METEEIIKEVVYCIDDFFDSKEIIKPESVYPSPILMKADLRQWLGIKLKDRLTKKYYV